MRITALLLAVLLIPVAGCTQEQTSGGEPAPTQGPGEPEATPAAGEETTAEAGEATGESGSATLATGEGVPADSEVATPARTQVETASQSPATSQFRENTHYRVLTPTQPTSSAPDQVEVAEVFWYGCNHCYAFEPHLVAWAEQQPNDVAFVRIPAMWNPATVMHARAFYTAEALGVLDRVHNDLFKAIHEQGKRLLSKEELATFFAQRGVDESAFRNAFESFAVETALQRADQLNRRYRISSTPTMVINGKYVTGSGMTNGFDSLMALVEELVERERAGS